MHAGATLIMEIANIVHRTIRPVSVLSLMVGFGSVPACVDFPSWEDVAPADTVARAFIEAVAESGGAAGRGYVVASSHDEVRFQEVSGGLHHALAAFDTVSPMLVEAEILDVQQPSLRRLVYDVASAEEVLRIEIWMREVEGRYRVDTFKFGAAP
jgi:hypothetical protein